MRVLITSASRPLAHALARLLFSRGHTVLGVDTESILGTSSARFSRAYARFFALRSISELSARDLQDIDTWIPCGEVPDHMLQLCSQSKSKLTIWAPLFRRQELFHDFIRERILARGLGGNAVRAPLAFNISSTNELYALRSILQSRRFTVTSVPYAELKAMSNEDFADEDTLIEDSEITTTAAKASARSYRVTEIMEGGYFIQTHCLIVTGAIRTFMITTANEAAGTGATKDWTMVAPSDTLHEVLYEFTWDFVAMYEEYEIERQKSVRFWDDTPQSATRLSTHVNITFHVSDVLVGGHLVRQVTAISCDNVPHESLLVLANIEELQADLDMAYTAQGPIDGPVMIPASSLHPRGICSFPSILSEVLEMFRGHSVRDRAWWLSVANLWMMLLVWALCFQEEIWCWRDPGPALAVWVLQPLAHRLVRRWKRLQTWRSEASAAT